MADFKVSKERVKIFHHPNADKLEIALVGDFQLVSQKGMYEDGQEVYLAPKRAMLPPELHPCYPYLSGGRVKSIKLRGEISEGVLLPVDWVEGIVSDAEIGEDISLRLGIEEYNPATHGGSWKMGANHLYRPEIADLFPRHDCENHRKVHIDPEEWVTVTEKLHGSQIVVVVTKEGEILVSSKGVFKRGCFLAREEGNLYWESLRSFMPELEELASRKKFDLMLVGEVIPCQQGFSYGLQKPEVRWFRYEFCEGYVGFKPPCPSDSRIKESCVPSLYRGRYGDMPADLHKGQETVSGKGLHIREGCVISVPKPSLGKTVFAKVINPKYEGDDDDLS